MNFIRRYWLLEATFLIIALCGFGLAAYNIANADTAPNDIEQIIHQIEDMRAGSADVAQIAAVAVIVDAPEPFLDHQIGKADNGVSGVRTSWLILARKSDFRALALSAWALAATRSSSAF